LAIGKTKSVLGFFGRRSGNSDLEFGLFWGHCKPAARRSAHQIRSNFVKGEQLSFDFLQREK